MSTGKAIHQMQIRRALADGSCRTTEELAEITGLSRRQVAKTTGRMILRRLVERVEIGCYRLTEAGLASEKAGEVLTSGPTRKHTGRRANPQGSFRQRAWAAMRMSGKFTVPDLLRLAARPGERGGTAHNLHRYLRALERAGYIRRLPVRESGTRPGSNGFIRWILMRDTGPECPALRNDGTLIDRNTGEIMEEAA